MFSWILNHLHLSSGALGIAAHIASEGVGYLKDRQKFKNIEDLAELREQSKVQVASYNNKSDLPHLIIVLALLILFIIFSYTNAPDNLTKTFGTWTGIGVFWFFGRLTIKR